MHLLKKGSNAETCILKVWQTCVFRIIVATESGQPCYDTYDNQKHMQITCFLILLQKICKLQSFQVHHKAIVALKNKKALDMTRRHYWKRVLMWYSSSAINGNIELTELSSMKYNKTQNFAFYRYNITTRNWSVACLAKHFSPLFQFWNLPGQLSWDSSDEPDAVLDWHKQQRAWTLITFDHIPQFRTVVFNLFAEGNPTKTFYFVRESH